MTSKVRFQVLGAFLAAVSTLAGIPTASANGNVSAAHVTQLSVENGVAWVHFDENIGSNSAGRPGCIDSGWGNEFMFNPTTEQGKAYLAMLQVALLSGKAVDASGPEALTCFNSVAEQLGYVKLYQ